MKKSLCDMAEEYEEAIKKCELAVLSAKERLRNARREGNGDECQKQLKLIAVYNEEIRDMKITAEKLRNYYEPDEYKIYVREAV